MEKNRTNKVFVGLLGIVVSLFILFTLSLFIRHNVAEAPLEEGNVNDVAEAPVKEDNVNTEKFTQEQSSTTLSKIESVVEKKIELENGVTQEIRNEVPVKEWRHPNGTVVTLYEKDYFYEKDNLGGAPQIIVRAKKPNGDTVKVFEEIPSESPRFGSGEIQMLEFSPQGNFVVIDEARYESSRTSVFDLRTGKMVLGNDTVYSLEYAWPYWNMDESKLLLLSSAYPIGGCEHCPGVWYSDTGSFTNAQPVVDLSADMYMEQPFFGKAQLKDDTLVIEVNYYDSKNNDQLKLTSATFSFKTGKLASEVPYLNN